MLQDLIDILFGTELLDEIIVFTYNFNYVHNNAELILRSIDRAEIYLHSLEFNLCELCTSNNDYQECSWCLSDIKINYNLYECILIMSVINYYGD